MSPDPVSGAIEGRTSCAARDLHAASGDGDKDSLHILPLASMPVITPALRRARLIRNGRLQTMVELFEGAGMGSGQITIGDVGKEFGWVGRLPPHPDLIMLRKLAELSSYDVYSLRILLRENGIALESTDALRLSAAKAAELTAYMTDFTRPLLAQIYGAKDLTYRTFDDLIAQFRNPDLKRAREKLTHMASRLGIGIEEIPKFLEDYGDIFMSISYYRNCLDSLGPPTLSFLQSLQDIRSNCQLKQDANLMLTCGTMQRSITESMMSIRGLFAQFEQSTNDMWDDLTADRFRKLEAIIKSYHTTIGGMLCALSVKINMWSRAFPERHVGGLIKRAEFVLLEMKQGFDFIHIMKDRARLLAATG